MIAIPLEKVDNVLNSSSKIKGYIIKYSAKVESLLKEPFKDSSIIYSESKQKAFDEDLAYYNRIKGDLLETKYVELLTVFYEEIVLATPAELEQYRAEFNKIIPEKEIKTSFKDILIKKMGYKSLRDNFYPEYFAAIGIKACVYCNSQLTVVSGGNAAHFEVDHYLPKAELPCFSTSFYNLYPICGSCNKRKSINPINFKLYQTDKLLNIKSDFSFSVTIPSLAYYLVNGDPSLLEIMFDGPEADVYNKVFRVKGIYDTQKDVAEELITKSQIYNDAYKESLIKSFGKLYSKSGIGNRLLIGNYCEVDEIHNRPLAKFMQDIARQLDLLE